MSQLIQVKRGLNANLGTLTLQAGEPAFVTDTGKFYVGDGTNKILINPDVSTNAATADKLTTARTIALTGDVTGSGTFDGSANLSITSVVVDDSHNHSISTLTGVQALLDAKAPLASPTFTGTPAVPTATAGTNTTQAASTAFVTGAVNTAVAGNVATATKLATARTISATGDATGSTTFDGSANASMALTLANSGVTAGTYAKVTVDAKGRVTTGTSLAVTDIPTLTLSKISDAGTAASKNTGTASGNVPVLDSNGKLDTNVLPGLALTTTNVVADQTSMLALTAEPGDLAVRTDLNKTYVLKTAGASTLTNWQELLTPTDSVTSVAGKTGVVTLTASDVGLGNVANLSVASMFTSPALTGTPTAPTATVSTNTTQVATTAFVLGQVGTATPLMNGTAAVGTSLLYSRQDHVHASDTSRAPLASPTFTGTPAAPTATAGTNSTQIATTAFVTGAVSTAMAAIDGGTF